MSPRNEEQNALIKDERREQILSAALRVFATRGFAATKIGDIAARAGLSHGLMYHYFSSKEEIFLELLKRAMFTSASSIRMMDELPVSPLEKVRQTAQYILGGIENYDDSSYYFMIVVHAAVMDSPSAKDIEGMSDSMDALRTMAGIIKAGQEAGEMRSGDPMGMTVAFFAAIQGLAIYKLAMEGFKMPDPEIIVNMIAK